MALFTQLQNGRFAEIHTACSAGTLLPDLITILMSIINTAQAQVDRVRQAAQPIRRHSI